MTACLSAGNIIAREAACAAAWDTLGPFVVMVGAVVVAYFIASAMRG